MEEKLLKIFRTVFSNSEMEINDEMTANDVPQWDSLVHIQLIVAVEKEFAVKFKNSEIARLKNVGDLKNLIAKYYR